MLHLSRSNAARLLNTHRNQTLHCCAIKLRSHYDVLGVDQKATQTQVKNAYYTKSKELHPDSVNSLTDEERDKRHVAFVELKAAYDVLRRPADRKVYDERLSGRLPEYTASMRQRRHQYHNYSPPPQYDYYGQDWRRFWQRAPDGADDEMSADGVRKRDQDSWRFVIRFTLLGLGIVTVYNLGYLWLVYRRDRDIDSLVAKDEIARSFLRQREFAGSRDDPEQTEHLAQLLRADIDEAHQRKLESLQGRDPREIREEYRWLSAVRHVDPSKGFRLRRRAAIEEEQAQRRAERAQPVDISNNSHNTK